MQACEPGESSIWSGDADYDDKHSGTLHVTNRRLFFEYKKGILRRRNIVALETPLKEIRGMSIERGPWNWNLLVITAKDQRYKFILREESSDVWIGRVSELINDKSTSKAAPATEG